MRLTNLAVVVVGFTVGVSSAAAGEVRTPADDTVYPAMAGMAEGTEVSDAGVMGSEGIFYPGPRTAYVWTPVTAPSRTRADDTAYPAAERPRREVVRLGVAGPTAEGT